MLSLGGQKQKVERKRSVLPEEESSSAAKREDGEKRAISMSGVRD